MRFALWQVWGMFGDILEDWGLGIQAQCARNAWKRESDGTETDYVCANCGAGIILSNPGSGDL